MLYCLIVSNFFLIVASVLGKEKKKNKYQIYDMKNSLPEEIFDEKEVVKQNLELPKEETEEEKNSQKEKRKIKKQADMNS